MRRLVELITNAGDGQLSASRLGILMLVGMTMLIDSVSMYMMLSGTFKAEWLEPVCTLNSALVGSLALAYYSSNK